MTPFANHHTTQLQHQALALVKALEVVLFAEPQHAKALHSRLLWQFARTYTACQWQRSTVILGTAGSNAPPAIYEKNPSALGRVWLLEDGCRGHGCSCMLAAGSCRRPLLRPDSATWRRMPVNTWGGCCLTPPAGRRVPSAAGACQAG